MNSTRRTTGPVARAALLFPLVFGSSLRWAVPELTDQTRKAPPRNAVGIVVAGNLRPTVAFALLHSPTFREQFERARAWPHVSVRLSLASPQSLFGNRARGNTNWLALPRVIQSVGRGHGQVGLVGQVSFAGTIECRAAIAPQRELAAVLAHELAHANELARYGSITRAPGFRPSASGSYLAETEPAIEIGRRVSEELMNTRGARLSPREIAFLLDPELQVVVARSALLTEPPWGLPAHPNRSTP